MTQWNPTNPPLMLRGDLSQGSPTMGFWDPNGEGNPLLWQLIDLLTKETPRPQPRASRKNIIDRRDGRFPLDNPRPRPHRNLAPSSLSKSGLSPLDALIRWMQESDTGRRAEMK